MFDDDFKEIGASSGGDFRDFLKLFDAFRQGKTKIDSLRDFFEIFGAEKLLNRALDESPNWQENSVGTGNSGAPPFLGIDVGNVGPWMNLNHRSGPGDAGVEVIGDPESEDGQGKGQKAEFEFESHAESDIRKADAFDIWHYLSDDS